MNTLHDDKRLKRTRVLKEKTTSPKMQYSFKFFAEVELGVLRKNCRNYGICRINPISEKNKNTISTNDKKKCIGSKIETLITCKITQGITIEFFRSNMKKCCELKYFPSPFFKVDEDFSTIVNTTNSGGDKTLSIKKGEYLITKTNKAYTVHFY